MHFVPQVILSANALAAGIKTIVAHPPEKNIDIEDIHNIYRQLREALKKNHPIQYGKLTIVERILYELNQELISYSHKNEDSNNEVVIAANLLLKKLESTNINWSDRINDYDK